jgi:putative flippase GtrA
MNQLLTAQFLRFILANSIAALANILTRLLASFVMIDALAVLAGFCAGLTTSYLLCRGFVFQTMRRATVAEILRFTGINLLALLITWIVYQLTLRGLLGLYGASSLGLGWRTAAHALGVAAPVFFSFIAQKTFTFRQRHRSHGA